MYREHRDGKAAAIPAYLSDTYWWAYVHPNAVSIFERQWLVNAILWGNFARLRNAALAELGEVISGRTLQLSNLKRKLSATSPVTTYQRDSTALGFADGSYDQVIVFFLLHEQPADARRETLREALRVTKPGGKVVIVDYHGPHALHPLRYVFQPVLRMLEPFAIDLWRHHISEWLPESIAPTQLHKETFFGGLYQKVVINV
jgi:SAM-dependent methyltransferase